MLNMHGLKKRTIQMPLVRLLFYANTYSAHVSIALSTQMQNALIMLSIPSQSRISPFPIGNDDLSLIKPRFDKETAGGYNGFSLYWMPRPKARSKLSFGGC